MRFTAEDFHFRWSDNYGNFVQAIVDKANTKLEKWLSEQKVVYSYSEHLADWNEQPATTSTHKALLINIEEIKKECVEHEPINRWTQPEEELVSQTIVVCKHCGKKLKANWVLDE